MSTLNTAGLNPSRSAPRTFAGDPLRDAVLSGDAGAAGAWISHGAKLETRDADGRTPLLAACFALNEMSFDAGSSEQSMPSFFARVERCAMALVEAGADVSCADADGRTPLMLALGAGAPALARVLLRRGANPMACDTAWQNAWFYAIGAANARRVDSGASRPPSESVAALLEHAAHSARSDTGAARHGPGNRRECRPFERLDTLGPSGLPPLARAAIAKDAASCNLLLAAGADPDRPIDNNRSPFFGKRPRDLARGDVATAFTLHFAKQETAELFRALGVKARVA